MPFGERAPNFNPVDFQMPPDKPANDVEPEEGFSEDEEAWFGQEDPQRKKAINKDTATDDDLAYTEADVDKKGTILLDENVGKTMRLSEMPKRSSGPTLKSVPAVAREGKRRPEKSVIRPLPRLEVVRSKPAVEPQPTVTSDGFSKGEENWFNQNIQVDETGMNYDPTHLDADENIRIDMNVGKTLDELPDVAPKTSLKTKILNWFRRK